MEIKRVRWQSSGEGPPADVLPLHAGPLPERFRCFSYDLVSLTVPVRGEIGSRLNSEKIREQAI
jgi:hypothetical protein